MIAGLHPCHMKLNLACHILQPSDELCFQLDECFPHTMRAESHANLSRLSSHSLGSTVCNAFTCLRPQGHSTELLDSVAY